MQIKVMARTEVAENIIELVLTSVDGSQLPSWEPGAHIDLQANHLVRQYSPCGDPADRSSWTIAVQKAPQSRGGSLYLVEQVAVGDVLNTGAIRNNFVFGNEPGCGTIAGGIGVTPLIPMLAVAVASGTLGGMYYGGRSAATMAYRGKVKCLGGERSELFFENMDGPIPVYRIISALAPGTDVYCCGPDGLMTAVADATVSAPGVRVRFERFSAEQPDDDEVARRGFTARLARSDLTLHVGPDESILQALDRAGVWVPTSCSEGICGSCETRVLAGSPLHRDSVIDRNAPDADTTMMVCVSRSVSDVLVLDL